MGTLFLGRSQIDGQSRLSLILESYSGIFRGEVPIRLRRGTHFERPSKPLLPRSESADRKFGDLRRHCRSEIPPGCQCVPPVVAIPEAVCGIRQPSRGFSLHPPCTPCSVGYIKWFAWWSGAANGAPSGEAVSFNN